MKNAIEIMGRIVKRIGYDENNNCWIKISTRSDNALKNSDGSYVIKDNHRVYKEYFIKVIIARHREDYFQNIYIGQLCLWGGIVLSDGYSNPVILINDIYQVTDKSGKFLR